MKKKLLLLTFCVLSLLAVPSDKVDAVTKVTLNKSSIILPKKSTYRLKVTGTKRKVKWSSNKKKIATVSKSGLVAAKKSGTAYVTAKIGKKKIKCKILVRSEKSICNKLSVAYDWHCEDLWNNGYCNIYHYIEDGRDAVGKKINIDITIQKLNKAYTKRSKYNQYVYAVQGNRFSKYKKIWKKLDKQNVRLHTILNKNGTPKPCSNYYFPYEKYSDYLWDLCGETFSFSY